MHLQWFPGHMTKAIRMMEDQIKLCHGVVYVLDARAPFACLNKNLDKIFGNKPVCYVINKCDLVENSDALEAKKQLIKEGKRCITFTNGKKEDVKSLLNEIKSMLSEQIAKNKAKQIKKILRIMIVGIPNTGKSTIINSLCGSKKTKTGDKAGVTRDKQWINIGDFELLDTPGTTPPSFDSQDLAKFLAYIGSLNDEIIDFYELSFELIKYLKENYPKVLTEIYKVEIEDKELPEIFDSIGRNKGCLKKGGIVDEEKTSAMIISDLRHGRLGKIMFR